MSDVGDRLKNAINEHWQRGDGRKGSIRAFQREIEKELAGERAGASYPAINGYLNGDTEPSLHFLRTAAELLGVRASWLMAGDGDPTESKQRQRQKHRIAKLAETLANQLDDAAVEADVWLLNAGKDQLAQNRRDAVMRFARKLRDAGSPGVDWLHPDELNYMLAAAMRFLVGVDRVKAEAIRLYPDASVSTVEGRLTSTWFVPPIVGRGRYVAWSDDVLDLFSRDIYGLGEDTPAD